MKLNDSYDYWQENIMDERLNGLDSNEKYELYLHWKNEIHIRWNSKKNGEKHDG